MLPIWTRTAWDGIRSETIISGFAKIGFEQCWEEEFQIKCQENLARLYPKEIVEVAAEEPTNDLIIADREIADIFSTLKSSRPKHIGASLQNLAPKRKRSEPKQLPSESSDAESDEEFVPSLPFKKQKMVLKISLPARPTATPTPTPTKLPKIRLPQPEEESSSCDISIDMSD